MKKLRATSKIRSVDHPTIGSPRAENKRSLRARVRAYTIENALFVTGRRYVNPGRSQPSQRRIVGKRC